MAHVDRKVDLSTDAQILTVALPRYDNDKDISLFDLLTILIRRKYWFILFFISIFASGCAYTLLRDPAFSYTGVVQVGEMLSERGTMIPISSTNTAVASIQKVMLPAALRQYIALNPKNSANLLDLNVTISQQTNSDVLLLRSTGTLNKANAIKFIEQTAMTGLARAQGKRAADMLNYLKQQRTRLHKSLSETQRELASVHKKLERGAIPVQQVFALEQLIDQLDQDKMLTRQSLETLNERIVSFRPTRVLAQPYQSITAVGPSNAELLLISAFFALVAGLCIVFFVEFIARFRTQRN